MDAAPSTLPVNEVYDTPHQRPFQSRQQSYSFLLLFFWWGGLADVRNSDMTSLLVLCVHPIPQVFSSLTCAIPL